MLLSVYGFQIHPWMRLVLHRQHHIQQFKNYTHTLYTSVCILYIMCRKFTNLHIRDPWKLLLNWALSSPIPQIWCGNSHTRLQYVILFWQQTRAECGQKVQKHSNTSDILALLLCSSQPTPVGVAPCLSKRHWINVNCVQCNCKFRTKKSQEND